MALLRMGSMLHYAAAISMLRHKMRMLHVLFIRLLASDSRQRRDRGGGPPMFLMN